jgi:hypothetical protein
MSAFSSAPIANKKPGKVAIKSVLNAKIQHVTASALAKNG